MYIKNQKGLTLLEVLLSIVILTIILVTVMKFFPQMGLMNKQNEDKQQAVNLVKKELNKWKIDLEGNFDEFLLNPDTYVKRIHPENKASDMGSYWLIETKATTEDNNRKYDMEIKISKNSNIVKDPMKVYVIQVNVKNNHNTSIGETYGYIIYEKRISNG